MNHLCISRMCVIIFICFQCMYLLRSIPCSKMTNIMSEACLKNIQERKSVPAVELDRQPVINKAGNCPVHICSTKKKLFLFPGREWMCNNQIVNSLVLSWRYKMLVLGYCLLTYVWVIEGLHDPDLTKELRKRTKIKLFIYDSFTAITKDSSVITIQFNK